VVTAEITPSFWGVPPCIQVGLMCKCIFTHIVYVRERECVGGRGMFEAHFSSQTFEFFLHMILIIVFL
jgi:hypothetical protein